MHITHPLVLYLPCSNQSLSYIQQSMAFFSDDLNHDTSFVFVMEQKLVNYWKQNYPHIAHIEYSSNGCAGQYKNFKILLNLAIHQNPKPLWTFSKLEFFCCKSVMASLHVMGLVVQLKKISSLKFSSSISTPNSNTLKCFQFLHNSYAFNFFLLLN